VFQGVGPEFKLLDHRKKKKHNKKMLFCPTTDEWIKKMRYLYTMKFYIAIKNEIVIHR
jgi:hypothetical protein